MNCCWCGGAADFAHADPVAQTVEMFCGPCYEEYKQTVARYLTMAVEREVAEVRHERGASSL